MEEPILNAHNKAEYEPAHTGGFDTRLICSLQGRDYFETGVLHFLNLGKYIH